MNTARHNSDIFAALLLNEARNIAAAIRNAGARDDIGDIIAECYVAIGEDLNAAKRQTSFREPPPGVEQADGYHYTTFRYLPPGPAREAIRIEGDHFARTARITALVVRRRLAKNRGMRLDRRGGERRWVREFESIERRKESHAGTDAEGWRGRGDPVPGRPGARRARDGGEV